MADNNYFVGVDVGSTACKAVAINSSDNTTAAKALTPVMGDPENAANICLKDISKSLIIKAKILKKNSIATGLNSDKISINYKESEIICVGKGALDLNPDIRLIIDVGAFSMKSLKLDEEGKIEDFLMNARCAGGSGILLELVAEALELNISDLANEALKSKNPIQISSQCSIFAESEVISYKNEGANIVDLLAGVCNSVAGRMYPLILRLDKEPKNLAFTGGVAKNEKIVQNLEERLNLKLTKLQLDPQYITAYGAAIMAKAVRGEE